MTIFFLSTVRVICKDVSGVICERFDLPVWYVTCDLWHVTYDMWYLSTADQKEDNGCQGIDTSRDCKHYPPPDSQNHGGFKDSHTRHRTCCPAAAKSPKIIGQFMEIFIFCSRFRFVSHLSFSSFCCWNFFQVKKKSVCIFWSLIINFLKTK